MTNPPATLEERDNGGSMEGLNTAATGSIAGLCNDSLGPEKVKEEEGDMGEVEFVGTAPGKKETKIESLSAKILPSKQGR
mmetsp:Transcript_24902/g.49539  ORF Transcript_24902/g.49539 Transcript_24902/m.49539 type:complete len:80 (-) Transcript_24902:13-252(-)